MKPAGQKSQEGSVWTVLAAVHRDFKSEWKSCTGQTGLKSGLQSVTSVASSVLPPCHSRPFVDVACRINCPYQIRFQTEWRPLPHTRLFTERVVTWPMPFTANRGMQRNRLLTDHSSVTFYKVTCYCCTYLSLINTISIVSLAGCQELMTLNRPAAWVTFCWLDAEL